MKVKCAKCRQWIIIKKENNRCQCGAVLKYIKVERKMERV